MKLHFYIFILLGFGTFHVGNKNIDMISKILKTIILGPPGSGKGTISERIVKDFGMKHLSSGDVLRHHVRNETAIGQEAQKYIANGSLVPDVIMMNLIGEELEKLSGASWLLDGFPRTVPQAKTLINRVPVDLVINLDVPFEVIVDRIKGRMLHPNSGRIYHTEFNPPKVPGVDDHTGEELIQRHDDKEETVRERLKAYIEETQPVINYWRHTGILKEFSGNQSNEIWPLVHDYLASHTAPLKYTEYK